MHGDIVALDPYMSHFPVASHEPIPSLRKLSMGFFRTHNPSERARHFKPRAAGLLAENVPVSICPLQMSTNVTTHSGKISQHFISRGTETRIILQMMSAYLFKIICQDSGFGEEQFVNGFA
jgi:hypothetical protein